MSKQFQSRIFILTFFLYLQYLRKLSKIKYVTYNNFIRVVLQNNPMIFPRYEKKKRSKSATNKRGQFISSSIKEYFYVSTFSMPINFKFLSFVSFVRVSQNYKNFIQIILQNNPIIFL